MTVYAALTIRQPWATLIVEGFKVFEFRGWHPSDALVGERLAIHAGKRFANPEEIRALLYKLDRGGDMARGTGLVRHSECVPLLEKLLGAPKSLPISAVIGLATMGKPIRNQELALQLGLQEAGFPVNDSTHTEHSNWGWPLTDIVHFPPPYDVQPGARGIWYWKDHAE